MNEAVNSYSKFIAVYELPAARWVAKGKRGCVRRSHAISYVKKGAAVIEGIGSTVARAEGQFLIHFYLADGSHEMDAQVLHACEGDVLGLIAEVAKQLDVQLRVEARAHGEGGLVVMLTFIGKHAHALTLIGTAVAGICGGVVWWEYQSKLLQQQIDQNELILKKTRLELKKLEQEVSPDAQKAPATAATKSLPLEPPAKADDVLPALVSNRRVIKLRSQFYEQLLPYERVDAVGFAPAHHAIQQDERIVPRADFNKFVVKLADLESTRIENAEIEIVAPVLKRGSGKWRGIFEKRGISFELSDEAFVTRVMTKKVKFQNGTTLICNIEMQLRETEDGKVEPHAYVVEKVHKYFNKGTTPTIPTSIAEALALANKRDVYSSILSINSTDQLKLTLQDPRREPE